MTKLCLLVYVNVTLCGAAVAAQQHDITDKKVRSVLVGCRLSQEAAVLVFTGTNQNSLRAQERWNEM